MSYSLTNHFLIAMPNLQDQHFHHSVILVVEHNAGGAMGLVINHPTEFPFAKILDQFEIKNEDPTLLSQKVLRGGPLKKDHGFILHRPAGQWKSTALIGNTLGLTTSRDILAAMIAHEGPDEALVMLGCAGWLPGQLETEIRDNYWLSTPCDPYILFACPYHERWNKAAALIGVDMELISCEAGHA